MKDMTTMPDPTAAEAFAEQVSTIINHGAVANMMSIGHRTGLFDVMATMPPASSVEIAETAQLAERYVREWLAVMVTGRIVTYDPARRTYHLPPEHAACLTRRGELGNLAVYSQHVALMGEVQEKVLERFETGEGLSYGDYPCFHQFMAEDSAQTVTAQLFDTILTLTGITGRLHVRHRGARRRLCSRRGAARHGRALSEQPLHRLRPVRRRNMRCRRRGEGRRPRPILLRDPRPHRLRREVPFRLHHVLRCGARPEAPGKR
jgi:hypothetical protein